MDRMQKNDRLILVTNDDGVGSQGLAAAIEVARTFGRVVVVAPETMQSGMSQAITMYSPLFLRRVRQEEGLDVYAFSGTPVDCVKMGFDCLLREEKVDLVISGINHGSNSAVNVLYSGTMGAAIEGSFYGCPSVGLSLANHASEADFEGSVL
ncbi:MAG: 5'/3'-nucleotidase SurE, partial [Alistipes sp.]|nr:5'/3'-nucleotidase SurE [Alistipes sp.]